MTITKESHKILEKIEEDVERLRDWLDKQPHLPHDIDSGLLRSFVVGTKGLEIAKQKLDSWFSFRGKAPQLFSRSVRNHLTNEWRQQCECVKMFFLPKPTPEGYRVMWYTWIDGPHFNHHQKIVRSVMQLEVLLSMFPDSKGLVAIYDLPGVTGSILTKLSPTVTATAIHWLQSALPLKLKKVLAFNAAKAIENVTNAIIKPALKDKLFNRIKITSEGKECLKDYLPIEMLPADYGGNEKHSDELNADWHKLLEERADWFEMLASQVSDENKRPADKNHTYGVEGTFRTLSLD